MEGHTLMATDNDPGFTDQEVQLVEMLVAGKSQKRIAGELGVSSGYIGWAIREASFKVGGDGAPSHKLKDWFWSVNGGSTETLTRRTG